MSSSGTLGRYAIARQEHLPLCMNTSVIRFRPLADSAAYAFVYGYLISREFYNHLTGMANGSAQVNFGPTHLKKIEVPWPDEDVIRTFNKMTMPLIETMNALRSESNKLATLRNTLLPKLMSGEIDVSKVDLTQLNSHLVNQAIRRFVARCEVGYGAIRKSSLINLAVALRVFQKKGRYRLANAFDIPSEINCKMKFSIVFRCFFPNLDRTRANQQLIIRCENMKSNVVVFR